MNTCQGLSYGAVHEFAGGGAMRRPLRSLLQALPLVLRVTSSGVLRADLVGMPLISVIAG
jgi:hypothetical protein